MSNTWTPPPAPSPLGRYRVLSPLAGIRVSPLQLGAMSIGDQWEKMGFGVMNKESSFKLLDAYYAAGGNFIDTSSNYQDETSEKFIGEWMERRNIRDQIVLATKVGILPFVFVFVFSAHEGITYEIVHDELQARHQRHWYQGKIDILYLHWWDWQTSIEEVVDNLHHLVTARKVLYLGISDTPAWIVSYANAYAKANGKTPFVIYQGQWSILDRSFEREIIPMARTLGLALAPWGVLASGRLRTDAEEERRLTSGENGRTFFVEDWRRTEDEKRVCTALEKVANEVGAEHITAVAIAYVMQKTPYVFPIIGGRKVEHLQANIEALKISLSDEQIQYLEGILPFDLGTPQSIFGDGTPQRPFLLYDSAAQWDRWPQKQVIKPAKST